MRKRAEAAALRAFPGQQFIHDRCVFRMGFEEAEKICSLSWRDILLILSLNDELEAEESMPGMPVRSLKDYCQTLLERYNEERERRNKIIYDGMDRILSIGTNTKDTDE